VAPVIRLDGVSYRYPSAPRPALSGLDLRVAPGESLLLAGRSGSGKSTAAWLLNGVIPGLLGGELTGSVRVAGHEPARCAVADFLDRVGLVLQDPDAQLFNATVEAELAYGLESLGLAPHVIAGRVRRTAAALGIEALLGRAPEELSGGERRLVALASVLVLDPPIVVMDEPFSHLDRPASARLRALLARLRAAGRTLLLIEQRVEPLLGEVDRCVVLAAGQVRYDGPAAGARAALADERLLARYPPRRERPPAAGPPLLEVRGLACAAGARTLFGGLAFTLHAGRVAALVGPIGSGKTTLLRCLVGLERPLAGGIALAGRAIVGRPTETLVGDVAAAFQNPNDQLFAARVGDELLAGPRAIGRIDEGWLAEVGERLGLAPLLERSPWRLSEGQKKRVALAAVLALRPRVLLLDEPTVGQDGEYRERLAALLGELGERGMAILVATHDEEFARAVADDWITLAGAPAQAPGAPARAAAR